jgi:hypothetical protein
MPLDRREILGWAAGAALCVPRPGARLRSSTRSRCGRWRRIPFAAFAGWGAAGAKSFGYPVYWVNRAGLPAEELGQAADGTGRDLNDLVRFVLAAPCSHGGGGPLRISKR